MYAILDLETTGLFNRDRVVEAAIVHADATGEVTGRWHTLVNPLRDLGPVGIHGIRAFDARRAPTFDRVAGDIARLMAGRVPVVHNITFDSRILAHEYLRLGLDIPHLAEYGVCTMGWAPEFLPGGRHALADCCTAAGIRNDRPHEALSDALATTDLLRHYLRLAGTPPPWHGLAGTAKAMTWPDLPYDLEAPVHRTPGPIPDPGVVDGLLDAGFALRPGDTVVLTGSFPESKQHWADRYAGLGLRVAGYVTKATALVVAADPDTMSIKATRARAYGIPVAGVGAVERLLGGGDR